MIHRFYWFKKITDGRPNLVLSHQMIQKKKAYAIALDQQYYSGHSYNAMHTVVGLAPMESSTLVLVSNRVFTDKVLGFASKHPFELLQHALPKNRVTSDKLMELERGATPDASVPSLPAMPAQDDLFSSQPHPVVDLLRALDVDDLSPREALDKLYELKSTLD